MQRVVEELPITGVLKINSSSKILNIWKDNEDGTYKVEYYRSPFSDELDVYNVEMVYLSEDAYLDDCKGYTFHGKKWDNDMKRYMLFFSKQNARIKNK